MDHRLHLGFPRRGLPSAFVAHSLESIHQFLFVQATPLRQSRPGATGRPSRGSRPAACAHHPPGRTGTSTARRRRKRRGPRQRPPPLPARTRPAAGGLPDTRRHTVQRDRAAAVRTSRRGRRHVCLVSLRRLPAAPLPSVLRPGSPPGTPAASLRPVLGEGSRLSAAGAPRRLEVPCPLKKEKFTRICPHEKDKITKWRRRNSPV